MEHYDTGMEHYDAVGSYTYMSKEQSLNKTKIPDREDSPNREHTPNREQV